MSTIYSVTQIIGKTLIANTEVAIKRTAADGSPSVYTVKKGQAVGQVYSYLEPNPNRKSLYWMFLDAYSKPYYVEHKQGLFSIQGLTSQGAITIEEEVEQQKEAENPKDGFDKTKEIVQVGLAGVGIWAAVQVVKTFKQP